MKRFHLCTGFHSHYQFFYGNSHFRCHFPRRRFPLQPARQCFSHLIDPVVIFLQRTAYLQYPVVPEITFDLSDDHGNCIGGKFHIIGHVKLIHCFQKSDAADLEQILHLHPTSQKTLCHTVYQSCIFLKQKISCRFIPLVCTPDEGKSTIHSYLLMIFFMCTVVPRPTSDSTRTSSINASMKVNPIPERSLSGFVVNMGSMAFWISAIPTP